MTSARFVTHELLGGYQLRLTVIGEARWDDDMSKTLTGSEKRYAIRLYSRTDKRHSAMAAKERTWRIFSMSP